jgi:6-phosphogluconolactonase
MLQELWSVVSLSTLCLAMLATSSAQADTYLYVSQAPEQAIRVFKMNDADGTLTDVETFQVDGTPGASSVGLEWLNTEKPLGFVEPKGKFLFVSLRSTTKIGSYRIDPSTGKLSLINTTQLADGANAAYVQTDNTGKYLFSASYAGGRVVVHALDAEGRISVEPLQVIETAKTAHCIAIGPANETVHVPHVAPNAVYKFRFDEATGKLTQEKQASGGRSLRAGIAAGPRHLAMHPGYGSFAFTSDESGSSVTLYEVDADENLTPRQTLSTLPDGYAEKNTTAEVKVHPWASGRFVWVSNRGHDSLAGFSFAYDELTGVGTLKPLGQTPTEKTPRSFDIEPSGRFLFAAGEGSGNLQAYAINTETGALTPIKKYEVGKSLTWVTAVKVK